MFLEASYKFPAKALFAGNYLRVSTPRQAEEGYSLDEQERALEEYCKKNGYKIYDTYRDEGKSAKDMKHRPELLRLLSDVRKGHVNVVCVRSLSRLTRCVVDLVTIIQLFNRKNVKLVSMDETVDTTTAVGRLILIILVAFYQFEREVTGERVKKCMVERAQQGKCTCTYVLGYNRIGEQLEINQKEAEIVKFIYNAYLNCGNMLKVSEMTRIKKYRGKRGAYFSPESIHKILTRPIYCGYFSQNNEIFKGNFPPIVSVDTYNQAQRLILTSSKGRMRIKPLRKL